MRLLQDAASVSVKTQLLTIDICSAVLRAVELGESRRTLYVALLCYASLASATLISVNVGFHLFGGSSQTPPGSMADFPRAALCRWDAIWLRDIAEHGYEYDSQGRSSVAFFPLYPILTSVVAAITTAPFDIAGLFVSNWFAFGSFYLLILYEGLSSLSSNERRSQFGAAIWLRAFPTSFFLVMGYSESLFLFFTLAAMWGLKSGRIHIAYIAILCGITTGTRFVGIAMLPVLAVHCVEIYSGNRRWKVWLAILPIAVSGLLLYSFYLRCEFGDALVFAKAQDFWRFRPKIPWTQHFLVLLSAEPIWTVYDPSLLSYWQYVDHSPHFLLSLQAANPILFVVCCAIVIYGFAFRLLDKRELILSVALLLIPYSCRSYEMCMASQGRFALVAFPVFLVMSKSSEKLPTAAQYAIVMLGLIQGCVFATMWGAGYLVI